MQLDPNRATLIVVDMQNSFCKRDGKVAEIGLDTTMCEAAIEPCQQVVELARRVGMPIIFTRYVYEPDYSDGGVIVEHLMPQLAEVKALQAGSKDADIVADLEVGPDDIVLDKNRPSSFYGTELDAILAGLKRDQLVVCGVTTNCCVESTVRDASHRDLQVFVVEEATGELDQERHEVSLRSMGMLFAQVMPIAEYRKALG